MVGVIYTMLKITTVKARHIPGVMSRLTARMASSVLYVVLAFEKRVRIISFMTLKACKKLGYVPNYIYARQLDNASSWDFKGDDCVTEFVLNFVDKYFRGFTFIVHNTESYDSFYPSLIKEKYGH